MNLNDIRKKLNDGISLTNLNLRVTYYSRVSTEYKEQIKSLINQNEYFENYIKQNNNWKYIEGYIDKGISGTTDKNRKSFMKMIKDATENKFDLIITKEISRFSRNTLDSIKYTRELLDYGVAVLFINDNINTLYPDSELRLTIMASLAQDEIRRLSKENDLFTWDKPAYACLATRIPEGETITGEKLHSVEKAEDFLFSLGFTDFRVRMLGDCARLQFTEAQLSLAFEKRREITEELKKYYKGVLLDLEVRK